MTDGAVLGSGDLDGGGVVHALLVTGGLEAGTHRLTVRYGGDAHVAPAEEEVVLEVRPAR